MRFEAGDSLPAVHADQSMLEQVMVNLLLNALDAVQRSPSRHSPSHEAGSIVLRTSHDEALSQVVITLLDDGPGIPETLCTRIFEPFFTTKEPGEGTGLGLTIAYGLVSEMGGLLEVQSPLRDADGGTAFHIILPHAPVA